MTQWSDTTLAYRRQRRISATVLIATRAKCVSQNLAKRVTLSEAKHLKSFSASEILRCAQDAKHGPKEFWDRL